MIIKKIIEILDDAVVVVEINLEKNKKTIKNIMKKMILKDLYPIMKTEFKKSELKDWVKLDDIINAFVEKITQKAKLINIFDHYTWSKETNPEADIYDWIIWAKNIVFCGWVDISVPEMLAIKPRSISIAEFEDKFFITMLQVPKPEKVKKFEKMILWIKEDFKK